MVSCWRRPPPMALIRRGWGRPLRCCCFMPARYWVPSRWRSAGSCMRKIGIAAAFGFVVAASLFAGDLTLRHYAGHGLFPMAAPTGGTLLIVSWLGLAVAAAWPKRG